YYFSYEVTRRHETGFSSVGQNNFELVPNLDLSAVYGLPPGFITGVSATRQQAQFFSQTLPAALIQLNAINPALAAGYAQEAAAYATFVGASSGIAQFGAYPGSFALLEGTLLPIPGNGSNPLQQFITSCNLAQPNNTCNGLPSQFLGL